MNQERIDQLIHLFHERFPLVRTFGMKLSFDEHGHAIIEQPYNPDLDNGVGGIHGGVMCALLDSAGWFTAAACHPPGFWIVTSHLSIHFLAPAQQSHLRAEGQIVKAGRRQDICEMHLYDAQGKLIGFATGTFVALPEVEWR